MKIPQLARYNGTVSTAYEFVNKNITQFPVNPFLIIKNLKWGLITYDEMALNWNCTVEDICECLGEDGYCMYNGQYYTIAYNNTIKSKGRINFTLAHEIGHIILNHHKDFEVTEISKDNFTEEEYKILENEANCFARNILAPAPLVRKLSLWSTIFDMPNYFDITPKASRTRISFLKNDLYYLNDYQINELQNNFKQFKYCDNCKCGNFDLETKYCPMCGNKKITIGDGFMKYKNEIKLDENKKATICPRCGNEEILEGPYCKICGLELFNKCINYDKDTCIGCGEICDANARYCHKCGSKTSYYNNNIIPDYKSTNESNDFQITEEDYSDLPF